MPVDRTSNVEAGGIQMEAGRSTDDRISGNNKLMEEEYPPLAGETFGSHYALGVLFLGEGKDRSLSRNTTRIVHGHTLDKAKNIDMTQHWCGHCSH
jgi:hypothetical protein